MSVFDKGLVSILVCCAAFILASIPLILRRVPRNRIYGYRTRTTLSDDALWYRINAYFGARLVVASLMSAGLALALHFGKVLDAETYLNLSIVLIAAPAVGAAWMTARFARRPPRPRR